MRVVAVALLGCGCVNAIDEAESRIGEVTVECVVANVGDAGSPVSLEYDDSSLWIFPGADNRAVAVSNADEICASGVELGAEPLLALSQQEELDNESRGDGKRLVLEPSGGFVHEGRGYLFYEHNIVGPGFFDLERQGSGLCLVEQASQRCDRVDVEGETRLWQPNALPRNRGGLVDGEGDDAHAFVFGCRRVAAFTEPCIATGAPLDALTNPSAYQPFNAFSGFVNDPSNATVIVDDIGPITISPYGEGFLLLWFDIFTETFHLRRSSDVATGYGSSSKIFQGVPPADGFARGGRGHAGIQGSERELFMTYENDDGLHLIGFAVFGEFR